MESNIACFHVNFITPRPLDAGKEKLLIVVLLILNHPILNLVIEWEDQTL